MSWLALREQTGRMPLPRVFTPISELPAVLLKAVQSQDAMQIQTISAECRRRREELILLDDAYWQGYDVHQKNHILGTLKHTMCLEAYDMLKSGAPMSEVATRFGGLQEVEQLHFLVFDNYVLSQLAFLTILYKNNAHILSEVCVLLVHGVTPSMLVSSFWRDRADDTVKNLAFHKHPHFSKDFEFLFSAWG